MERSDRFEQGSDDLLVSCQGNDCEVPNVTTVNQEIDVERLIWDPDYRTWAKARFSEIA